MSALLLLWLSACEPATVSSLPEPKRDLGCAIAAHPARGAAVDRAALEEIYKRPELARARQRDAVGLEVLIARLNAWVDRFFGTRGAETYSVVTRWLVMLAGALIALYALVRFLGRRRRSAPSASVTPGGSALKLDDPAVHFARAKQALAGAPRDALREALLGLLSSLERARLARPDRVKTNRELVRELPSRGAAPELAKSVAELIDWYDDAFYSLRQVAPADAQRFVEQAQLVGARTGAAT